MRVIGASWRDIATNYFPGYCRFSSGWLPLSLGLDENPSAQLYQVVVPSLPVLEKHSEEVFWWRHHWIELLDNIQINFLCWWYPVSQYPIPGGFPQCLLLVESPWIKIIKISSLKFSLLLSHVTSLELQRLPSVPSSVLGGISHCILFV